MDLEAHKTKKEVAKLKSWQPVTSPISISYPIPLLCLTRCPLPATVCHYAIRLRMITGTDRGK
eukprot:1016321-Rhodomonas_salina.2